MTLYLTDLDGTLLNYSGKLKPRACEMLNRFIEKNVLFSYATARGFLSSRRLTSQLNLNIPVITMNGALIVDSNTGKHIHSTRLSEISQKTAHDYFIKHNETPLVYAFINGLEKVSFLEHDTVCIKTYLNDRKGDIRFRPCKTYDELFEGDIFYYCITKTRSSIESLNAVFIEKNGFAVNYQEDTYNKDEYWYEIFEKSVSKGAAAKKLMEITGAERLVVFGDNINDISMFKVADECYAVENAHKDLKKIATSIIASNEELGVPVLIEKQITNIFHYEPKFETKVNHGRFSEALQKALNRERGGIGTLNEKLIHATLKNYFTDDIDHEAKIGIYYADAISENGIYEIQTASWGKLCEKLNSFLDVCHVTIVYPFEKRVHNIYINEKTGELIKKSPPRLFKDMTAFFMELYRIKAFLTNPNLTVCIAELEVEKTRTVSDERCIRKRGQKIVKTPAKLLSEIYLEKQEDYKMFLPDELPEKFDKRTFNYLSRISNNNVLMEILEYMSVVHKCEKKGKSIIYSTSKQSD